MASWSPQVVWSGDDAVAPEQRYSRKRFLLSSDERPPVDATEMSGSRDDWDSPAQASRGELRSARLTRGMLVDPFDLSTRKPGHHQTIAPCRQIAWRSHTLFDTMVAASLSSPTKEDQGRWTLDVYGLRHGQLIPIVPPGFVSICSISHRLASSIRQARSSSGPVESGGTLNRTPRMC